MDVLIDKKLEIGRTYRITYGLRALTSIFRIHQATSPWIYLTRFSQNAERKAPGLRIVKFNYSTVPGYMELTKVSINCFNISSDLLITFSGLEGLFNAMQNDYHWDTLQIEDLGIEEVGKEKESITDTIKSFLKESEKFFGLILAILIIYLVIKWKH